MPEDALEVPLDHGAGRGHFRNAARLRHPEPVPQGAHRVEGRPGRPVDAPQLLLERVGDCRYNRESWNDVILRDFGTLESIQYLNPRSRIRQHVVAGHKFHH